MKLFYDFFPIILFFIAYKLYGIYVATGVAIAASCLQVLFHWFKTRRFDKLQVITMLMIAALGGLTIVLHNDIFIKWKPTIINWIFGLAFLGSQFIGKYSFVQRLMQKNVQLPDHVWTKLNTSWVVFFLFMGTANLYVVYNFSTNAWVNFKLFGMLGITLIFVVFQAIYLARYIKEEDATSND